VSYENWLPTFAPSGLADWLILAICIYEAYQTRKERNRNGQSPPPAAPRLRYWPWVTLAVLATIVAWLPVYIRSIQMKMPTAATTAAPTTAWNPQSLAAPPSSLWYPVASSAWSGPLGPILAVELVQTFKDLPQPCQVRLTVADDKINLARTLSWLLGRSPNDGAAGCEVTGEQLALPYIEMPMHRTNDPGVVIHWNSDFRPGEHIAHFFDASGFNVRISHDLPTGPPNQIWIEIGPGSPWKVVGSNASEK